MARSLVSIGCIGLSMLALTSPAEAHRWRFFEGVVGVTQPLGLSDYKDFARTSAKGGLRFGSYFGPPGERRLAWEGDLDFTYVASELMTDGLIMRLRAMGGVRLQTPITPSTAWFARGAVGVDFMMASVDDVILGETIREESSSIGPVLEPGAGFEWHTGILHLGAQAALPLSYHHDGDKRDRTFDFDYFAAEIDVLFTIGAAL